MLRNTAGRVKLDASFLRFLSRQGNSKASQRICLTRALKDPTAFIERNVGRYGQASAPKVAEGRASLGAADLTKS